MGLGGLCAASSSLTTFQSLGAYKEKGVKNIKSCGQGASLTKQSKTHLLEAAPPRCEKNLPEAGWEPLLAISPRKGHQVHTGAFQERLHRTDFKIATWARERSFRRL